MKNKKDSVLGFSIIGFLLFFATIGLTAIGTIVVYNYAVKISDGNNIIVGVFVFITVLIGAGLCTVIDIFRRKLMIEQPLNKILEATQKISAGDFSVKIEHDHEYGKYNEYDLIIDNINLMTVELKKNAIVNNNFVSNVSHEIKTPLAVIQNYVKTLSNNKITAQQKEEYLVGLNNQTKKLSELVTNILKLNKLENQQIVPEVEKFDLSELLRICTLQFESLFEKKNLKLECDIDDCLEIKSSANLLEIVFNNLISNAIKFTNDGGTIGISLKKENGFAVIKVTDTGIGISKEVGQHIFDKFYQGDTSRASEGNGLGLALVKKVIDVVGGEIIVESNVGKGSTFIVKLKLEG